MRRIICDSCSAVLDDKPHLVVRVDGHQQHGVFLELCSLECLSVWARAEADFHIAHPQWEQQ